MSSVVEMLCLKMLCFLLKYSPCSRFCCVDLFSKVFISENPVLIRPSKIPLVNTLILEVWFAVWDVLSEIAFLGSSCPCHFPDVTWKEDAG